MDPLHPMVPIQPPAPTPPNYNRVERIDRDGQQQDAPDWQRGPGEDADEDAQQQFEDDYDPDWSDPAASEPYGPDGAQHDVAAAVDEPPATPVRPWDPRTDRDRRTRPRDGDDGPESGPGSHIDISA